MVSLSTKAVDVRETPTLAVTARDTVIVLAPNFVSLKVDVARTTVVPGISAVTTPFVLTVATVRSDDDHVSDSGTPGSRVTVGAKVVVAPSSTVTCEGASTMLCTSASTLTAIEALAVPELATIVTEPRLCDVSVALVPDPETLTIETLLELHETEATDSGSFLFPYAWTETVAVVSPLIAIESGANTRRSALGGGGGVDGPSPPPQDRASRTNTPIAARSARR